MGAAEGTFDIDLELKKSSSVATTSDEKSNTFNWIQFQNTKERPKENAAKDKQENMSKNTKF